MPSVNGLDHVIAAKTGLSHIDGERGILVYRGHFAGELAKRRTFEEVAHLLWTGRLPDPQEQETLRTALASARRLPDVVRRIVDDLPPSLDHMSVLRTAVSAAGVSGAGADGNGWPPTLAQAIRFAGLVPAAVARHNARLYGQQPLEPDPILSHVADSLRMILGHPAPEAHVRALEGYLILTMDHGLNASTFAARVVTSTQSDMASALTAALGAMKGPLHGGAPSEVMDMLDQIGDAGRAEAWLRARLDAGERLMGFGHRLYRTRDPRAAALHEIVAALTGDDPWFNLAVRTEAEATQLLAQYKPGRRLYTNVEYWAAAIFRTIGIPKPLYTPTFSISRVVGWTAHILEQATCNRLIRPRSEYDGPLPLSPS